VAGAGGRRGVGLGLVNGGNDGAVWQGGEEAGLPEADDFFQLAENAGQGSHDHGFQCRGQPAATGVRLGGGTQACELSGKGVWLTFHVYFNT